MVARWHSPDDDQDLNCLASSYAHTSTDIQGMLAGLSSHVELIAHSSYINYVGATNILTFKDGLGLFGS